MDVKAEKLWLIDRIMEVSDERLIKAVKSVLELGLHIEKGEPASDFWNDLTDVQKVKIEKSIRQLENGEGIPHEAVMSRFLG